MKADEAIVRVRCIYSGPDAKRLRAEAEAEIREAFAKAETHERAVAELAAVEAQLVRHAGDEATKGFIVWRYYKRARIHMLKRILGEEE